jgi:hypothetical protein
MQIGIVKGPISRELYRAIPAEMKIVLLANGQIVIDDEGRPCVAEGALARTFAEIERALGTAGGAG